MRVRCGGAILCGSLLELTLVAGNTQACTCAGPAGAKTMREVAEWYSEGPNASKIIFERTVERQEAVAGPIGAPREAYVGEHVGPASRRLRARGAQVSR